MVFLKEFAEKSGFEKNQQMTKKHEKLPSRQRDNCSQTKTKDSVMKSSHLVSLKMCALHLTFCLLVICIQF